jgi:hypothetical protein
MYLTQLLIHLARRKVMMTSSVVAAQGNDSESSYNSSTGITGGIIDDDLMREL